MNGDNVPIPQTDRRGQPVSDGMGWLLSHGHPRRQFDKLNGYVVGRLRGII